MAHGSATALHASEAQIGVVTTSLSPLDVRQSCNQSTTAAAAANVATGGRQKETQVRQVDTD